MSSFFVCNVLVQVLQIASVDNASLWWESSGGINPAEAVKNEFD